MNYCKGIFANIIILFIFFYYQGNSQVISVGSSIQQPGQLIGNWEFFSQDDFAIKDTSFPSSKIIVKSVFFKTDSINTSDFKGVVWFRKKIKLDSSINNKALSLHIQIIGAAEVYIDQKLVKSFGIVSGLEKSEELVTSDIQRIAYPFIPNKEYLIAIRYSHHNINYSYTDQGLKAFGLKINLSETDSLFDAIFSDVFTGLTAGLIISVFFFSLSFVHFIIFLFYREEKTNAYYSFFCLTAATLVGAGVFKKVVYYEDLNKAFNFIFATTPSLIFMILPYMLRSFFNLKFPNWYRFFIFLFLLNFFGMIFSFPFILYSYILLVLVSVFETARAIIIALKHKMKGVKIIATGTFLFLFFVVSILLLLVIMNSKNVQVEGDFLPLFYLFLIILCIFSIPISITIFLSYQISLTNRSLKQKLVEVEELSKQSIEQEKEKQKILENQKSFLKEQVLERTYEITEQKKIIEEKNKDIIDSINYAKRIQTAILPEMNFFKSVFNDSFIIYEPRDIVSGDFYYVTEINDLKILFIADCTGHGVPGALMSMVGSNLIHKIIHENKIFEPKDILQTLHVELRQALKQDQSDSQNRDGMDAAIVILKEDKLIYAGANRSLLYFNKENELCEVKPTKTPIGGSHITVVDIVQNTLNRSDIKEFYLFSDGFADQFGGLKLTEKHSAGKKLMISRFKSWLTETLNYTLEDKETFLTTEFKKWKGDLEQVDDVCVICVRL
jgi:serine phosphatase RsbU (regulator of sigma subunit)